MSSKMWGAVIALTAVLMGASAADAASISLVPGGPLIGLPGDTIGWGYEIFTDPGFFIDGNSWNVSANIITDPSGDTTVDTFLFDFPDVPANSHLLVPYDPINLRGFFEVRLSSFLALGQTVTGEIFGSFDVLPVADVGISDVQTFSLTFAASVAAPTAVPESGTLFLLGLGLTVGGYRFRRNQRRRARPA